MGKVTGFRKCLARIFHADCAEKAAKAYGASAKPNHEFYQKRLNRWAGNDETMGLFIFLFF